VRVTRILDTYVAALCSQANASKEVRSDGLGTTVVEVANTGVGPIDNARLTYAIAIFAGGLALSLCFVMLAWKRLIKSKVRFEEEQMIEATLAEANWRDAANRIA
jgi:hypothetical protein